MNKFKSGDRIRVYSVNMPGKYTVKETDGDTVITSAYTFHYRQCRLLKVKKKEFPETIWLPKHWSTPGCFRALENQGYNWLKQEPDKEVVNNYVKYTKAK